MLAGLSFTGRARRWLLALLVLILVGGGALAWWYHHSRPDYRFGRGRDAVRRGDWDEADLQAERLDAAGQSDRARLLRGESLLEQRRPVEALAELNRVSSDGPWRQSALLLSGRCLLAMQEWGEATRLFSYVLDEDADNVDAHRGLASAHYDLGHLHQARRHLERVTELDPRDGRPYRLIGLIDKDTDFYQRACQAYRAALERDLPPAFRRDIYRELPECLIRLTRYQEALTVLDEGRAAGIDNAELVSLRAECLWRLGEGAAALPLLDQALRLTPEYHGLWLMRGRVLLEQKQFDRAVAALEQAARLKPKDYDVQYQLGRAYAAAGRGDDARRQQALADELKRTWAALSELTGEAMSKPLDPGVRERLAQLCEQIDRPELAAMWYRAAEQCRQQGKRP